MKPTTLIRRKKPKAKCFERLHTPQSAAKVTMNAEAPIIELRGVTKDYVSGAGVVRALKELDLTILRGEFVAVVGTSGSGKSTLMNLVGCLDRPTTGTYTLAGVDVGERTNDGRAIVRNRLIGFIFQGFNLLSRTTAQENCELPLSYRGVGRGERRRRSEAALRSVGLGDRMDHTPNQLSGGQQQRVAIARALVTDPPLLLADEPTGNLDTRTSLEVLSLLQTLNRERGITIVLVTHEPDIAACASRVLTFRDGRCVSDVRTDAPKDAAHELAQLPPQQAYVQATDALNEDPRMALLRKIGGPLPWLVFSAHRFGGVVGGLLALMYCLVFGITPTLWWLVGPGLAFEALFARWSVRRRLGKPLTPHQVGRLVFFTSAVDMGLLAVAWLIQVPERLQQTLAGGGSVRAAMMTTAAMLTLCIVLIAVRFALATLLAPRPALIKDAATS
jgi:putative ABC transport system ATP-binding protein